MVEENKSQEFRVKNIDETKDHLTEEVNRSELMSKNHKKVYTTQRFVQLYWTFSYFSFYNY